MFRYSAQNVRRHWKANSEDFVRRFPACNAVFRALCDFGSVVTDSLASRKELEPNCAFLLFSKSFNHAFATMLLVERGLVIDAALSARNAVESLLLLELLVKQPQLCQKWAQGDEFRPALVRRKLAALASVPIKDVVIEVSSDVYEDARSVYSWLSRITHANLESLDHSAIRSGPNEFSIQIGGAHSRDVSIAIVASLGSTFLRAGATCVAAYAMEALQSNKAVFDDLELLTSRLHAGDA